MTYKIVKLDKRHNWRELYPYMVQWPKGESFKGAYDYDDKFRWFYENYGHTLDIETRSEYIKTKRWHYDGDMRNLNLSWSYCTKYNHYRIYLNESTLIMFNLRWS
jgi:hypothetical protein